MLMVINIIVGFWYKSSIYFIKIFISMKIAGNN